MFRTRLNTTVFGAMLLGIVVTLSGPTRGFGQQEVRMLIGHRGNVLSVVFSPDGKMLASGSGDNTVKLWDVQMGKLLRTLSGHKGRVQSVVFSPDGQTLASGSADRTVRLWDVQMGALRKTLTGHSDAVYAVAFSPDGEILASACETRMVKLWDARTGELLRTLSGQRSFGCFVAFSYNGQILATRDAYNSVSLWDMQTGTLIRTERAISNRVISVVFSPDGRTLAWLGESYGRFGWPVWPPDVPEYVWPDRGGSPSCRLDVYPDGKLRTDVDESFVVEPLLMTDYEESIFTVGKGNCWEVTLWNTVTGKCQRLLESSRCIYSIAFSPDGKMIAGGGRAGVSLWDTRTGFLYRTLRGAHDVSSVAFSPDGNTLASGGGGNTVRLWEMNGLRRSGAEYRSVHAS